MKISPLAFYDFMLLFLIACTFHDIVYGPVTTISFAWPVCLIYYYYRRKSMAKMIEKYRKTDEDS